VALKLKDSPLEHLSIENLYHAFSGLGPREKVIVLCGVGLVLLMLLFLPFSLASGKLHSMQRNAAGAQKGYREVLTKISDYRQAQREIQAIENKLGRGGSITSRVEGIAREVGVSVKQLKEKPTQDTDFLVINSVEVRIVGATLGQVVEFLRKIEGDQRQLMRLRRIQLKPKYANRQLLDVSCEIATFSTKKEA